MLTAMLTIAVVLLMTATGVSAGAYLAYAALETLQSSVDTPEAVQTAIPYLQSLTGITTAVVMIATAKGIWRLRK